MNYNEIVIEELKSSIAIKKTLLDDERAKIIVEIAEKIIDAYKKGKKVVWFGNGGSAADAQHLSTELLGKFEINRPPLRSISLTTNTSVLTAIGNDFGFENVFSRQVEAIVDKDDIVIGMSTSGNSPNVINGLKVAKERGAITIGFTGSGGGKIKETTDILLEIPSRRTRLIQEAYMTAGHTICFLVETVLFGDKK